MVNESGGDAAVSLEPAKGTSISYLVPDPPPHAPVLDVSVLGPLIIRHATGELGAGDLGGPKPRQVLEILLLNFGSAMSKTRIIDLLWNGKQPALALPTLESYVSVLRRRLQPGAGRSGPLRTVTGGYVTDRTMVELDLDRFTRLTERAAVAPPQAAVALLTEALDLASAPLLGEELLPAWAEEERARHAERVCGARVLAAESALLVGDLGKAIAWGSTAVGEDPLNERAWTVLVLALERSGENTEALRAFNRCRRIMDEELGCAPNGKLKEAHGRLLTNTAPSVRPQAPGRSGYSFQDKRADVPPATQAGTEPLRVLIVDDHTMFSDLLAGALDREPDFSTVGAASSVDVAASMFRDLQPDVVVLDLYLGEGSGLDAAERILAETAEARIVMLTGNPSDEALGEAARMGVCGFLPKDGALGVLLDTLRHARPRNMIVHPSLIARIGGAARSTLSPARL